MIDEKILMNFESRNVLITGGTGMIGRQVVKILEQAGASTKIVSLDSVKVSKQAEHIYGDLTDFNFCKEICKDMEYVFHIAGIGASVKSIKTRMATHFVPLLMMSTNVLEACRINKVKKTVFTSSVGAYANAEIFRESEYKLSSEPMDFAGWAKRMAEAQIYAYEAEYGLDNFAVVRPPNVYGPGDNFDSESALVIPSLLYRIYKKEDPVIIWGDGLAERDFAYSRDIAEGIILALWHGTSAGFVNLGSGRTCTVRELVETLRSFLDFNYEFDPTKPTGVKRRFMDISLARKTIGYEPTTSLKEGLKETWKWFIENSKEYKQKKNYFEEKTPI